MMTDALGDAVAREERCLARACVRGASTARATAAGMSYDPVTRALTLTGDGPRSGSKVEANIRRLVDWLSSNPGASGEEIRRGAGIHATEVTAARNAAVLRGLVISEKRSGRGAGVAYSVNPVQTPFRTGFRIRPNPVQPRI